MKSVRFTGHYRNYNAGEVAGFPDDHADELIAQGFAVSEADALAAEKAEAEAAAKAEAQAEADAEAAAKGKKG